MNKIGCLLKELDGRETRVGKKHFHSIVFHPFE